MKDELEKAGVALGYTRIPLADERPQGEAVFLWVFPITEAEADLKVQKGSKALISLMQEHGIGHIIDAKRPCMVTGRRPG